MLVVDDPSELGVNPVALKNLVDNTRRHCELGGLNSCQIAVARQGQLALFATIGEASQDSRYAVYSLCKPLLASAFWLLMDEHAIDVSRPVVEFIPEFGAHGKDVVSVEQLLIHTAGFPAALMGPPQWSDLGMFLQNFMLLAQEAGLATCPQEAWANWPETVAEFVDAPQELMLFSGMALGYANPDAPDNQLVSEREPFENWAEFVK